MLQEFIIAGCLVLVIEGIIPFVSPKTYRNAALTAVSLHDRQLRMLGLASMLSGTALLYFFN
ncbi:MAG: DUF2065 family protein [Pseudomonadota bacterium]